MIFNGPFSFGSLIVVPLNASIEIKESWEYWCGKCPWETSNIFLVLHTYHTQPACFHTANTDAAQQQTSKILVLIRALLEIILNMFLD